MCAELSGFEGGQERQTEIRRVKMLSFNILNETCKSFSPNLILKGNSLSIGKIFQRILKTQLTAWVGGTIIPMGGGGEEREKKKDNRKKPAENSFFP